MSQATERREREQWELDNVAGTTMAVENIRSATMRPLRGEERISVFWRVFGGTLLSIAALVCITIIQQFSSSLGELRTNLTHLNESRADLVKNEDFNARMTAVWNSLKELQGTNAAMLALKERSALLEQQLRTTQEQLNARLASMGTGQKEMETLHAALLAAKDRSALLEQQIKTAEDERKEMAHEVQRLRERLAVLEGRQAATAGHRDK